MMAPILTSAARLLRGGICAAGDGVLVPGGDHSHEGPPGLSHSSGGL